MAVISPKCSSSNAYDGNNHVNQRLPEIMAEFQMLLRTPTGLRDRLNDKVELDTFGQWRAGPGERIHGAIGEESRYDNQRMAFTTKKPYHDLKDVLDACQKAGQQFNFDVSNCEWSDVIEQMQKAQDVYKDKGDKNPVRSFFRNGKEIATTITPWFDMIPDQYGLSVLRAGLTVIFQAVQSRATNREKIFEAFQMIPEIFEKTQTMRELYPKEKSLEENAIGLYNLLLEEMPRLIGVLLRRHDGSVLKRWVNQTPGQEKALIDDSVAKVNKGYADLKNCLDNIIHKNLANVNQNFSENVRETKAIRQTAVSTHVRVGNVSEDLTAVGLNVQAHREESNIQFVQVENKLEATSEGVKTHITQNLNEKGEEIKDGLAAIEKKMDEMKRAFKNSQDAALETANANHATTIQTGIYYIVLEKIYYQGYTQPQSYSSPRLTYQKVSTEELLRILNVTFNVSNQDLGYVLRQSNNFKTDTLGHGRWLMTTAKFKNWLAGGTSDLLLVDGHCDRARIGKTSPMSIFCANFIASVVKLSSTIVLHFFCGQHATFEDPLRGPNGLLRSLICQLLLYPNTPEPNLEALSQQQLYNDLKGHELNALLHLFQQLVHQIPRGTLVFCIIDGISEYETRTKNSTEDLRSIISSLQSIVRQAGPTFKILMTSANKSTEIAKQIPSEQRVSLRAGNTYSRPISERTFLSDISRAKASIETAAPAAQGLLWNQNYLQPAQAVWDPSRLSIKASPTSPEPLPWMSPQRVQTLVGADTSPPPQPWPVTQPPPQYYPYQYG